MRNCFEQKKDEKFRLANVILLKVPIGQKDFKSLKWVNNVLSDSDGVEVPTNIIGGYSGGGWAASDELLEDSKNDNCFLFNLT